jgi:hypothetical protein
MCLLDKILNFGPGFGLVGAQRSFSRLASVFGDPRHVQESDVFDGIGKLLMAPLMFLMIRLTFLMAALVFLMGRRAIGMFLMAKSPRLRKRSILKIAGLTLFRFSKPRRALFF